MAAGEGKRMNSTLPKVLHMFKEKPMLVRIIETSLSLNPEKIIVITGKHDILIKKTLELYLNTSKIIFVNQTDPKGTGDAIKHCLPFYETGNKVLILNGDMPLINEKLLKRFISNDSKSSILVAKFENPKGYGRIVYNELSDFVEIVEEKDCSDEQRNIKIINSGVYFIYGNLLQLFIPMIKNNNIQNEYYLTDIVKLIKQNTDFSVKTHLLDESENKYISGVNTAEELVHLENIA
jgi:UDP-N-acetylglucosamine diphosphorylase/glucosamine-1-phosphate N-acetyltransferase